MRFASAAAELEQIAARVLRRTAARTRMRDTVMVITGQSNPPAEPTEGEPP